MNTMECFGFFQQERDLTPEVWAEKKIMFIEGRDPSIMQYTDINI